MPDTPEPLRLSAGSWWQCAAVGARGRVEKLVVVESDAYPDGERVELGDAAATVQIGDDALCTAVFGETGQVVSLHPSRRFAPKAPPLWFVEVRESKAHPPAVSLVAFTGTGPAAGTLLGEGELSNYEVRTEDQIGALRWYPASGLTDQLYVQPQWRRRNIASALLGAGECLSVARGWPRFWGDGQRTELGEQARNARTWSRRTAERTHVAPPMTPSDGTP